MIQIVEDVSQVYWWFNMDVSHLRWLHIYGPSAARNGVCIRRLRHSC